MLSFDALLFDDLFFFFLGDTIGASELQTLLETISGQPVSNDEVATALKALQPVAADQVTFDEFYKVCVACLNHALCVTWCKLVTYLVTFTVCVLDVSKHSLTLVCSGGIPLALQHPIHRSVRCTSLSLCFLCPRV